MAVGGAPASRAGSQGGARAVRCFFCFLPLPPLGSQAHAYPAASASVGARRYFYFESSRRDIFPLTGARSFFRISAFGGRGGHTLLDGPVEGRPVEELAPDVAIRGRSRGRAISTLCVVDNARGFVVPSEHRTFSVSRGVEAEARRPAKKRAKREVELRRAAGRGWPGLWRLATIHQRAIRA